MESIKNLIQLPDFMRKTEKKLKRETQKKIPFLLFLMEEN